MPDQALEEERLGPRRQPYSDERQKRLAVQEAATALVCTLMPAIEPVTMVRSPPLFLLPVHAATLGSLAVRGSSAFRRQAHCVEFKRYVP